MAFSFSFKYFIEVEVEVEARHFYFLLLFALKNKTILLRCVKQERIQYGTVFQKHLQCKTNKTFSAHTHTHKTKEYNINEIQS